MNTEITETVRGYVFYDAHCPMCRRWIGRTHTLLIRRGLHPVPLQACWAKRRLGLGDSDPLIEMKLLTDDGAIHGGVDALVRIARGIWWAWPLFVLTQLPGVKGLFRRTYMQFAANRPCDDGQCAALPRELRKWNGITSTFFELP